MAPIASPTPAVVKGVEQPNEAATGQKITEPFQGQGEKLRPCRSARCHFLEGCPNHPPQRYADPTWLSGLTKAAEAAGADHRPPHFLNNAPRPDTHLPHLPPEQMPESSSRRGAPSERVSPPLLPAAAPRRLSTSRAKIASLEAPGGCPGRTKDLSVALASCAPRSKRDGLEWRWGGAQKKRSERARATQKRAQSRAEP